MARRRLLIVGAGGHGRSVAEAALLGDEFDVVGFLDDGAEPGTETGFAFVLGRFDRLPSLVGAVDAVIVAIGNNAVRESLLRQTKQMGFLIATVVHPRAFVSPSAALGEGCAVMAGAVVGTQAKLGAGAIVNCGAVVDHHAHVHDFGHLGVNACMAGGSVLGHLAWMQAGTALGYGAVLPDAAVLKCDNSSLPMAQKT